MWKLPESEGENKRTLDPKVVAFCTRVIHKLTQNGHNEVDAVDLWNQLVGIAFKVVPHNSIDYRDMFLYHDIIKDALDSVENM